jgi:hypothetical protein
MIKNDIIVLIPHYNDIRGLINSLKSIDVAENVDILIVDDGSDTEKIDENLINTYFNCNGTILFIYQKQNMGIEYALNMGLQYILKKKYKFIARLDTGDKCVGSRFKIQRDFLNKNPDIMLIGSNVLVNNINGDLLYKIIVPTKSSTIKNKMFITSTIIHPTIMFHSEIINHIGFYPTEYKAAEDYAYYFKILKKYNFSNINQFLLEKELNPNSISIKKRNLQTLNRVKIIIDNFYFGYYPIIGLLRNYILYLIPNNILIFIKKQKNGKV